MMSTMAAVWIRGLLWIGAATAFAPALTRRCHQTRLASSITPTAPDLPEGIVKTIAKAGNGILVENGFIATVRYSCKVPKAHRPFAEADHQEVLVGEGKMIDGWDKVLPTMTVGERAVVSIKDPLLGYGKKGVPPFIPPDSEIEMELEVLDAFKPMESHPGETLGRLFAEPRREEVLPPTAEELRKKYEVLKSQRAKAPPKSRGIEAFLERANKWNFGMFFDGQTGKKIPLYLRPSLTFPTFFVLVGIAYWITSELGAVGLRGEQTTDELDQIILSVDHNHLAVVATMFMNVMNDLGM